MSHVKKIAKGRLRVGDDTRMCEAMRFCMRARGVTMFELAKCTNFHVDTWSDVLNGKIRLRFDHMRLYCDAMNVKLVDLVKMYEMARPKGGGDE